MKRLLDGDYEKMRAAYLGEFAHLCHMSPREVDASRLLDVCRLVIWIDHHIEGLKKAQDQQNANS